MIAGIEFRVSDRLLVVIPHPDDETLATGGLIQVALAAGLPLRVLVATDGDNNPWPQRWLEKRWKLGAPERVRWGARRREEARMALAILGVAEADVRFLGWPDQGLTAMLMDDACAEEVLAEEIRQFSPTLIALPSLGDRHPDHSALGVMLELALETSRRTRCRRLGYVVHGKPAGNGSLTLSLDARQRQAKRRALLAHASQLSLSRGRLLAMCERPECFEDGRAEHERVAETRRLVWDMPWPRGLRWLCRHELLLVFGFAGGCVRARLPLPRHQGVLRASIAVAGAPPIELAVSVRGSSIGLSADGPPRLLYAFAKIDRIGQRLFVFDPAGWSDACALGRNDPEQSLQASPAAGR